MKIVKSRKFSFKNNKKKNNAKNKTFSVLTRSQTKGSSEEENMNTQDSKFKIKITVKLTNELDKEIGSGISLIAKPKALKRSRATQTKRKLSAVKKQKLETDEDIKQHPQIQRESKTTNIKKTSNRMVKKGKSMYKNIQMHTVNEQPDAILQNEAQRVLQLQSDAYKNYCQNSGFRLASLFEAIKQGKPISYPNLTQTANQTDKIGKAQCKNMQLKTINEQPDAIVQTEARRELQVYPETYKSYCQNSGFRLASLYEANKQGKPMSSPNLPKTSTQMAEIGKSQCKNMPKDQLMETTNEQSTGIQTPYKSYCHNSGLRLPAQFEATKLETPISSPTILKGPMQNRDIYDVIRQWKEVKPVSLPKILKTPMQMPRGNSKRQIVRILQPDYEIKTVAQSELHFQPLNYNSDSRLAPPLEGNEQNVGALKPRMMFDSKNNIKITAKYKTATAITMKTQMEMMRRQNRIKIEPKIHVPFSNRLMLKYKEQYGSNKMFNEAKPFQPILHQKGPEIFLADSATWRCSVL